MRYAIVRDDVVENVILWDGEESFESPDGCELVAVDDDVSIGWTLVDETWTAPDAPEPPIPTEDGAVVSAKLAAAEALVALGVAEATARVIVGLPEL